MKILFVSHGRRNKEICRALRAEGIVVENLVNESILTKIKVALFSDYDIVHTDWVFHDAVYASIISRLRGKKATAMVRGYGNILFKEQRNHGLIRDCRDNISKHLSFKLLHHIFFISEDAQRKVEKPYDVDCSTSVAPNGAYLPEKIDSVNVRDIIGEEYGISIEKEDVVLITVTNLKFKPKAEGIRVLSKAMEYLPDNVWLLVLGDGKYLPYARKHSTDNVIFVGFKENVTGWLSASDIFVYCSFLDAFPTVMLEAQATGLPVVAGNIGGIPETAEHARLCSPYPEAFAQKLAPLVESEKLRRREGKLNREWIKQRDWNWAVNNYIRVWSSLLEDNDVD